MVVEKSACQTGRWIQMMDVAIGPYRRKKPRQISFTRTCQRSCVVATAFRALADVSSDPQTLPDAAGSNRDYLRCSCRFVVPKSRHSWSICRVKRFRIARYVPVGSPRPGSVQIGLRASMISGWSCLSISAAFPLASCIDNPSAIPGRLWPM